MLNKDFKVFYDNIGNALATKDNEWLHLIECEVFRFLQLTDRQFGKVFNLYKSYGVVGEPVRRTNGKLYTPFGLDSQFAHLESEV